MNYDRLILELMDRVSVLEDKVKYLESTANGKSTIVKVNSSNEGETIGRDTTKYFLNGKIYGKGKLVHAIVKEYVKRNPGITASQLMQAFDRSLQGSLGVVRTLEDVQENYLDYNKRFFAASEYIIHTSTEDCVVCSQWGIANIGNILTRTKQLGIRVDEIEGNKKKIIFVKKPDKK